MATILSFPPRLAPGAAADGSANTRHLHAPLVAYATPADIRRKIADERPDLFDYLLDAGHEPTALEELAEDWREFVRAVRRSPYSHALVAVFTIIGWTALLVAPIVLGGLR